MVLRPCHSDASLTERSAVTATASMRTALASLQSRLELLLGDEVGQLSPEQRSFLAVANRDGQRLTSLLADLELVAAADRDALELDWSPCDLSTIAHRAVEMVWPRAFPARKQIDLKVPGPVLALADERRLGDALLRITRIAVDASPTGGTVAIEVTRDGVELRYEADGAPADDELSLAVVDAVAKAHGGALTVAAGDGAVTLALTLGGTPAERPVPVPQPDPAPFAVAA